MECAVAMDPVVLIHMPNFIRLKHSKVIKGDTQTTSYIRFEDFTAMTMKTAAFLGYKNPIRTSQETHYVSDAGSSRLMLCKIWGFHGGDYEEFRLLLCGFCKNRRFGGRNRLHHNGDEVLRSVLRLLVTANVVPSSPIVCHPDDGGDSSSENVGSYTRRTA
jgi:hypothetical protein